MERQFLLPVTIATAVHLGVFFGIHRHLPAVRIADPMPPADAFRVPTVELKPEVADVVETAPNPTASAEVPRLPELPTNDPASHFTVPIRDVPIGVVSPVPITTISDGAMNPGGGGERMGILTAAALDRPPTARIRLAPEYPPNARRDGREGEVIVEFVVDESGQVTNARAVHSTDDVFNEAAVRAVSRWRFNPGTAHAQVVRFRMAVPIVFRLDQ